MRYSETKNLKPINWNDRVNTPVVYQNDIEWYQWEQEAKQWVTCAVGNQCSSIPRNELGVPIDYELQILGTAFMAYIRNRNLVDAKSTLKAIEDRVTQILRIMEIQKV